MSIENKSKVSDEENCPLFLQYLLPSLREEIATHQEVGPNPAYQCLAEAKSSLFENSCKLKWTIQTAVVSKISCWLFQNNFTDTDENLLT